MATFEDLAESFHRTSTSISEAMAEDMRREWPHVFQFFEWPGFVLGGRDFDDVEAWCAASLGEHLFCPHNRCVVGIRDPADAARFEARWR